MDISKLLARLTNNSSTTEKESLDKFLADKMHKTSESTPTPIMSEQEAPKKDVFRANMLKARQEASETPLGKLFGVSPMSPEEKDFYTKNSDPEIEAAFNRGSQMGLGMGSISNAPSAAMKALADRKAALRRLEELYASGMSSGKDVAKLGRQIIKEKDALLKIKGD